MLVSPAFYQSYVKLACNSVPPEIQDNSCYYPFFNGCRGAVDGSLLDGFVPMADTCSSVIFFLAGKGVQQMVGFSRMQGERGLPYHKDAITMVMQGFQCVTTCLFHTEASVIT
jgi:hypothetical protein